MGSCLSKKGSSAAPPFPGSASVKPPPDLNPTSKTNVPKAESKTNDKTLPRNEAEGESTVKKEVFIIKHRKSQDRRASPEEKTELDGKTVPVAPPTNKPTDATAAGLVDPAVAAVNNCVDNLSNGGAMVGVRTSNCTKEEVDAILIQCGRLSRSSSGKVRTSSGRVYSGSKRSYDFDRQNDDGLLAADAAKSEEISVETNEDELAERRQHRQRSRQSRPSPTHSHGPRRRTPSREREQRSSSRERRVSRSPGRRSENTSLANTHSSAGAAGGSCNSSRPGKMVSVPATVADRSHCSGDTVEPQTTTVKRISVKRNVGDANTALRTAASPRSQSPARQMPSVPGRQQPQQQNIENQQQPTLSRSSSRKAEQSPYRRNPLSELDSNSRQQPLPVSNKTTHKTIEDGAVKETEARMLKSNVDSNNAKLVKPTCEKTGGKETKDNVGGRCAAAGKEQQVVTEVENGQAPTLSAGESQKPQALTRSRSSRLSDLELNPQIISTPVSYTSMLLEDIQNFHQKQHTTSFQVPPCVTKACSIYEAVADLNSNKSSNIPATLSELRKAALLNQCSNNGFNTSPAGNAFMQKSDVGDPFVESEFVGDDDLMEPSIHKYVTVKRGGTVKVDDKEEVESSGSNSFVGPGSQQGGLSSSWEPGSADSSDCWTSTSRRVVDDLSPSGLQRTIVSEPGCRAGAGRELNGKKRDFGVRQNGIGRCRT